MFDSSGLSDPELIDALRAKTRAEAVAASVRLAVIAEVVSRHCDDEDDESARCAIDGWEYAAAEVSAACGLSRQAASGQMRIAVALRDRLPKVAALLAAGDISAKVAAAITWRTQLITDDEAITLIDTALAGVAPTLDALSKEKAQQSVDLWVEKFDPAAVRRTRIAARSRDISFGNEDDPAGTVAIWGRLLATDAATLRARLTEMANGVCGADPRSMGQRRADALATLGTGTDRLTCHCGTADCSAAGADPRSTNVTVYVLTDALPGAAEDDGRTGPAPDPDPAPPPRDPELHGEDVVHPLTPAAVTGSPGVIPGGGIVPAPLVAELVATGARVKTLAAAGDLPTESQYRPTDNLAAWVRTRDLTCTFPGCNRAAQYCDLDHTVPWPAGATHPGNLSANCRTHHLLKTFGGWGKEQHPDGSHTWTAPTAHSYTTTPMSRILFPGRPIRTPAPPAGPPAAPDAYRGLAMPQRRRTRAQTRQARIRAERRLNQEILDRSAKPPPR